jgi:hypothetical protein
VFAVTRWTACGQAVRFAAEWPAQPGVGAHDAEAAVELLRAQAGVRNRRRRRPNNAVGDRLSSPPGLHGSPLKRRMPLAGMSSMNPYENFIKTIMVFFAVHPVNFRDHAR